LAVRQPFGERVDGEPRGDLARLRTAHAVGDDEDRRRGQHRILVLPALEAGVR